MGKPGRPASAGGRRRREQVKAWEPERPSSADRLAATGTGAGPGLARTTTATNNISHNSSKLKSSVPTSTQTVLIETMVIMTGNW